jgi:hypothetical protein
MPHTYSLQNVPSSVAAGEAHYRNLLADAAAARRFVPERMGNAAGAPRAGEVLRRVASTARIRLGTWLRASTVPEATAEIRWPPQSIG